MADRKMPPGPPARPEAGPALVRLGHLARRAARWAFTLHGAMALVVLTALLALMTAQRYARVRRLLKRVEQVYAAAAASYNAGRLAEARDGFGEALDLIEAAGAGDHYLLAEIRRKHGESRALTRLIPISLEELARRAHSAPSPEVWTRAFGREHRGQTVILDTVLLTPSGPGGRPAMAVGYRVRAPDGAPVHLDWTNCGLFAGPAWQAGMRVVFAATLDGMTYGGAPSAAATLPPAWTVHFQPDGYVLLRDARLLKAAGLEVDEETAAAIERQAAVAQSTDGGRR